MAGQMAHRVSRGLARTSHNGDSRRADPPGSGLSTTGPERTGSRAITQGTENGPRRKPGGPGFDGDLPHDRTDEPDGKSSTNQSATDPLRAKGGSVAVASYNQTLTSALPVIDLFTEHLVRAFSFSMAFRRSSPPAPPPLRS